MDFAPEPVLIEVVAQDASVASQILWSYIDDVASRYYGRQMDEEIDAALREEPQHRPGATVRCVPRCPSAGRGGGLGYQAMADWDAWVQPRCP